MTDTITLTIDGVEIKAKKGQKIIEAAEDAGIYIPRLCWLKELTPAGSCRVCTVLINGRPQASCTQPATDGMVVLSETPELKQWRKNVVEMLFVEGNHYCMFCEKSGNCELQAMGYRMGVAAPQYPYLFPKRGVDASHKDFYIDGNRCIRCGRCVRAAKELDGKTVFGFLGRGNQTRLAFNGDTLSATELKAADKAASICPVGCIIKKRVGFAVPVGQRKYDFKPIGSDIEAKRSSAK
ncbi:MAG: (2Fe-2S)-binding protein [Deltaproteobacteria bacterium]|nr:(2Fe-2S)-binding protein [Deltaproteobacteria bacterium]